MVHTRSSARLADKSSTSTDAAAGGSDDASVVSREVKGLKSHRHQKKKSSLQKVSRLQDNASTSDISYQLAQFFQNELQNNPPLPPNYPSEPGQSLNQLNAISDRISKMMKKNTRDSYLFKNSYAEVMPSANVRFRALPFYELIEEIVKPTSINMICNSDMSSLKVLSGLSFVLNPQQIKAINSDQAQVLLRIGLEETTCEQNDHLPMHCIININNTRCPMPVQPPSNKPVIERKSPSEPLPIKKYLHTTPYMKNVIKVYGEKDYQKYAACVIIVKKLSSCDLLRMLRNKGTKHADYTRSLIKEKLREDLDCEIATTSLRVSLICPLGKMRMMYPCRASTCSHLQCFDASLFLQMNERKSTWLCPVCDKPALFENLVVDGYFQEVLSSSQLSMNCSEIQLHKDGSWSAHSKRDFNQVELLPKPNLVEVIQLDLDVIPICDSSNEDSSNGAQSVNQVSTSTTASTAPPAVPVSSSVQPQVVDLTSDSDDDLPLKKRFCKNYQNELECSILIPETVSSNVTPTPISTSSTAYRPPASPYDNSPMTPEMYQSNATLEMAVSSIISLDSPSPSSSPDFSFTFEPEPEPEPEHFTNELKGDKDRLDTPNETVQIDKEGEKEDNSPGSVENLTSVLEQDLRSPSSMSSPEESGIQFA